ncbi:hypothetical protein G7Y89_g6286 [Cudoniella acicularis]|uniref:RRM domain-containing protein n=1 Tax=Cudoniella acicularis TaxID=354080 RepID=A0A8H4W2K4_9HELO|nr:hypothetical protein G7Y89_g6286 [Cudoniella acicularis]
MMDVLINFTLSRDVREDEVEKADNISCISRPQPNFPTMQTMASSNPSITAIMHLIRRAAARAASSSPSTPFTSSRSIATSSFFNVRSQVQATGISTSVFRRFASDDAASRSSDGEQSSVSLAVNSTSSDASPPAESLSNISEAGANSVVDSAQVFAAASEQAYQPREDRPSRSYDNDGGERRPYNGGGGDRRGAYNGGGRGGYGGRDGGRSSYNSRGGYPDRSAPREGSGRGPPVLAPTSDIYIGNLLFDITAADLEREFAPYGDIKSAVIATDPRGLSKGFGYVQFADIDMATKAIEAKNQSVFEGRRLMVNYVNKTRREERNNPPSKTLFIGNLAFEMSDADLNKLFRDIRNVIDVRVAIDRRTGQPRGFAHADFVDIESATKARETLKGQEVYGRALRVDFSLGARPTREDNGANESSGESSF